MTTPEAQARLRIDQMLAASGWQVQDYKRMNLSAGRGVAIREFPVSGGSADYLLYVDGKAIGVLEAKPEGHALAGVELQSAKYTHGLPDGLPAYHNPLPFGYESTGVETFFTNRLEPDARSRPVFSFHRPDELARLVASLQQLRARLKEIPPLKSESDGAALWPIQRDTIKKLEASLAKGDQRALIQMATGSGKTFTAANFCYRLLHFAKAKRILFLVDRNTLGIQAENEFAAFDNPYTKRRFAEDFPIQRLKGNVVADSTKLCITTIQRLYSMLKGEPEFDEGNEENSFFETGNIFQPKDPLPVVYNAAYPPEFFDIIVVDECHRSIYNIWRDVLLYFDAHIIGLTATPTLQTMSFFHENLVQDYSHERAVADNVNVGFDVYRIETQITQNGSTILKSAAPFVPTRCRRTRRQKWMALDDDLTYSAGALHRDVETPSQIRTVLTAFKDRALPDMFPGRTIVPKTIIFAINDDHAENIVRTARDVFGKGNDFCWKVTSKTTGMKPEEALKQFRTGYNPRIAVTVDYIATGTDVRSVECLVFMRSVGSAAYFEQMKGRGCRIISSEDLQKTTSDAPAKSRFVIVDAVGVCARDKSATRQLDRKPTVSLEKIMQLVGQGMVHADLVSTLGARLAPLTRDLSPEQLDTISTLSGGATFGTLVKNLLDSVSDESNEPLVREHFGLPPDAEPTEEQWAEVEQARMAEALKPFHNPDLRDFLVNAKRKLDVVIDEISQDTLLKAAASPDRAQNVVRDFKAFCQDNKNTIDALRILYSKPYSSGLRFNQLKDLAARLDKPPFHVDPNKPDSLTHLWQAYTVAEPQSVKGKGGAVLADLVALVRHALHDNEPLVPVVDSANMRYNAWISTEEAKSGPFSPEQTKWLEAIRDHIIASLRVEKTDLDGPKFTLLGGLGKVYQLFGDRLDEVLDSMNEALAA
ncbi:DEAD/DEAH box helicase family protein [Deltaproteobacteria bacterium OttesenSCG-928-M10]|nr:DEAD/DEAH box helicase family protein [Deltaproteobacteria bacterium OttesenSCG-928-M10]